MKNRLPLFALAVVLSVLSSAAVLASAEEKPVPPAPASEPKTEFVYLELTGVDAAEVPTIAGGVGRVDGVRSVVWTLAAKEVKVIREVGKAAHSALVKAAIEAGAATAAVVPVGVATFAFDKVLHCGGCVRSVTAAILAVPGTKEAAVSTGLDRVTVVYDSRAVEQRTVADALAKAGFPVHS